jgi:hypothetical protein
MTLKKITGSPALYQVHENVLRELGLHIDPSGVARADAAGDTMHLARELEYVSAQTYQVLTDPIKGREFVDFTTIPDGAETFSYDMWDRIGTVDFIGNYSDFVGSADVQKARTSMPLWDVGGSYHYSVTDLAKAAFAKTSLPAERARSNRIVHEQKLDDLIALGDSVRGIKGLDGDFQAVQSTVGEWDPSDVEPTDPDLYEAKSIQLQNDFNKLLDSVEERTAQNFTANYTAWPLSFKKVFSRRFSRYDARSREAVMLADRQGVTLKYWKRLDTKSALSGPRALAWTRSRLVLEFILAYDYRELPPQAHAYAYQVPTMARLGGVCNRYPIATSRMDLDEDLTP